MKNKNLFLLLLLTTCWGPSFLLIKVALEEMPPLFLAGSRIALGALTLNIIRICRGVPFPTGGTFWRDVLITGVFAQALPFSLINWGEQFVDSAMASLLNGLTPLSTIFLAHFMLSDEKMSNRKLLGVMMGIAGLLILVMPDLLSGMQATVWGIVAISIAALSYGVGLVYARKHFAGYDPILAPSAQLMTVAMYLLPFGYFSSEVAILEISLNTILSIAVLGVIGTGLAFLVYFKLLSTAGASYVSSSTFILPIYGIVLGTVFLHETITAWMLVGAATILVGVAFANGARLPKRDYRKFDLASFSKIR